MYRLYIDETGTADSGVSLDPNHRFLSLTGVILHRGIVDNEATPALNNLKQITFGRTDVCLHRKDLLNKKHPFENLRDENTEQRFNQRLLRLMRDLPYKVATVVIDKQAHQDRYQVWTHDPYHYCLEVLLERFLFFLRAQNARGDVMAERRGQREDRQLASCYEYFFNRGTRFINAGTIQRHFTSRSMKMRSKRHNVTGLQISDLIAHPSALYVRTEFNAEVFPENFGTRITRILEEEKYYRSAGGRLRGFGIKWLP